MFPSQIEEHLLKHPALSPHYQLQISKKNNLDELTINVEINPDNTDLSDDERSNVSSQLQQAIKSYIGVSSIVKICETNSVPRSEGKAVRVVDNRKS